MRVTSNGKVILTTVLAELVKQNATLFRGMGYGEDDHSDLLKLIGYRDTLLNKSVVIAQAAGKLRRDEGRRVQTVKGSSGRNLYAYIEGDQAIYVILETPVNVLLPKDRAHLQGTEAWQLITLIDEIRVSTMDTLAKAAERTTTANVSVNEDPIIADGPVIEETQHKPGIFERAVRWIAAKF